MEIIWTILEALGLILGCIIGLVAVIIGCALDVCFMVFRTIRYWIIKGMTKVVQKLTTEDESFGEIWNKYLDSVWEFDMEYACRFDRMKFPSEEEP